MKPRVLDVFAGCGGFSYGFLQAGYEIVAFVENWKPAIATYQQNHPHATHLGTMIQTIPSKTLAGYAGTIDVMIGGPPCQGFSLCGKRDPSDARNVLYKEFLRCVDLIQPYVIVMENVVGLLSMQEENNTYVLPSIVEQLITRGYAVTYFVVNASAYGVPQHRKRLIILGVQHPLLPQPTNEPLSVAEALQQIPEGLNAHECFAMRPETHAAVLQLAQGERLCQTFNFSRQRLRADQPSKTITTKSMYVHPTEDRFLTPRELARLQSFPDEFVFCGSKTAMVKQIGNAVPPNLAKAIALQLKEVMFNAAG